MYVAHENLESSVSTILRYIRKRRETADEPRDDHKEIIEFVIIFLSETSEVAFLYTW